MNKEISGIQNILREGIENKIKLTWQDCGNYSEFKESEFKESEPVKPRPPFRPPRNVIPPPPKPKFEGSEERYKSMLADWEIRLGYWQESQAKRTEISEQWLSASEKEEQIYVEQMKEYKEKLNEWTASKQKFFESERKRRSKYEAPIRSAYEILTKGYFTKKPQFVTNYFASVLSKSAYPSYFPKKFELDYNPDTEMLIVDYGLPSPDDLPAVKAINNLFDDISYQVALRTVYELYAADEKNVIEAVIFNGWVTSINKATGHNVTTCILSVQVSRKEFLSIEFANVDPKACFKYLKGIGSSKLHTLTPIAPILNINREDKRFRPSYEVAHSLDSSVNIAAMDWQDFEHLIRELFEKILSNHGAEVKITQTSRDRGVDAIAFLPDPILGGKIVIQAKRYTNTVSVEAVRDLFGTVINEGATKGILVTTADYGPDAYDFAKDKPITLLNGGNLLHLLEQHGHRARIDLKEAKLILSEKDKGI